MRHELVIDEAAQARVAAAVRDAERRSRGEIVPLVVPRVAAWTEALDRGGIAGAMLATLAVLAFAPHAELWILPVAQVLAFAAGYAAARWPPLQRALAGKAALRAAALARATAAFLEHGLHRTAGGTGVLVFVALHEHEVVVVRVEAVHERMGPAGWEAAVAKLAAGLHDGRPADGFCDAIALVGDVLAKHFPRTGAEVDANELPDHLRVH